ncbi:unnamed protein product [Closterium sp. NIES-65]|nr:unnamed protein product [Closterium sp. NIES-65]
MLRPRRPSLRPRCPSQRPRHPSQRPCRLSQRPRRPSLRPCRLSPAPPPFTSGPAAPSLRPRHPFHQRPCRPTPPALPEPPEPSEPPDLPEPPKSPEPPDSPEPPKPPTQPEPPKPPEPPEPPEQPEPPEEPSRWCHGAAVAAAPSEQPCCRVAVLLSCPNRPVWADGLSLFDLTSGASPAPAADADATLRSQWATRDAAARLAVRRNLPTTERAHFSQYKSAQTLGVPFPPCCPLSPLLLRPTSLVLSRSVRRLPLARDAALARARGARARVELAGVVEVAVEAAEGVGVAVGVVAGVEVAVAAAEAEAAEAVAVGAEAAEVAEVEAAVVEEVELVGVVLHSGAAPVVVSASSSSSSSVLGTSPLLSSSVSGTRSVSVGGGFGPCTYVLCSSDRAGEQCGGAHPTQRCFGRLTDAWRQHFSEASEIPHWGELSRAGVAIYDLVFDAILATIYAVTISDEGDCYQCFPPDPGIGTAALGASEAAALGASASAPSGTGEAALSRTASASASLTFTLDSGASRSFFRDRTTLTPLGRPVAVPLVDPSGGPVLSHFSTVLPCPAAPLGTLSGLYLPLFSTNLVSGADLQDAGVHLFTPASQQVTHCSDARTGRHSATFSRRPGSSLYTLTTESPLVPASGQVAGRVRCLLQRPGPGPYCTLQMDVWGPARVHGQGHERYFLLVVDDYSRYTTFFPLRSKGGVTEVLIVWIRAARFQLRRSFGSDFPILRLHSDRGGEVSSGLPSTTPPLVVFYPPRTSRSTSVSQVDAVEPVEVGSDSGTAAGAEPGGADSGRAARVGAKLGVAESRGVATGGAEPGGATTGGAERGGTATGGAEPGGATTKGAERGGPSPGGAASKAAATGGAKPGAAKPARVASGGAGPGGSRGVLLELELLPPLWVRVPLVLEVLVRLELELLRVFALRLLLSVMTAVPLRVLLELLEVLQLEVLLVLVLPEVLRVLEVLRLLVLSLLWLASLRGLSRTSFRSFGRFLVFLLA